MQNEVFNIVYEYLQCKKKLILFMNIYNARKNINKLDKYLQCKKAKLFMNIYNARKILINFINICNAK